MKKIILSALVFLGLIMLPVPAIAASPNVDVFQDVCNSANADVGGLAANSAGCRDKNLNGGNPIYGPRGIITKIVNLISIMVGVAAVISIIAAGARFVTSGSNPEEVTKAREYVQYALVGLILAAAAQALVRLVLYRISV